MFYHSADHTALVLLTKDKLREKFVPFYKEHRWLNNGNPAVFGTISETIQEGYPA